MSISIQMTQAETSQVKQKADSFNTYLEQTQKIVSKSELGEADFLRILITQLKTQDPTKPMDDKDFIGQMAQMTSLKQMNRLTENMIKFTEGFGFTKAVALVDKNISWIDNLGALQSGKVDSIKVKGGLTFLNVAGQEVAIDQVTEVLGANKPIPSNVQNTPVNTPATAPTAEQAITELQAAKPVIIDEQIQDDSKMSEGNSQIESGVEQIAGAQQ